LSAWLAELKLMHYLEPAAKWAEEMGAATLDEILENVDDFACDLEMRPLEKKRLQKDGQGAIEAALAAEGTGSARIPIAELTPALTPVRPTVAREERQEEEAEEDYDAEDSAARDRAQLAREIMGVQLDDYSAGAMDEYADFREPPPEYSEPPARAVGKAAVKTPAGRGYAAAPPGLDFSAESAQPTTRPPPEFKVAGRNAGRGRNMPVPTADDFPSLGAGGFDKKGKKRY